MITWNPGKENEGESGLAGVDFKHSSSLLYKNPLNNFGQTKRGAWNKRPQVDAKRVGLQRHVWEIVSSKLEFTQALKRGQMRLRPTGTDDILDHKTDKGIKRRAEHVGSPETDVNGSVGSVGLRLQLKFLWAGFMNKTSKPCRVRSVAPLNDCDGKWQMTNDQQAKHSFYLSEWFNVDESVNGQPTNNSKNTTKDILNKCIQIQNTSKSSPKSFQTGLDVLNDLFILIVYTVQLGMKFTRIQSQAKLTETYFCIQAQQKHEQIESSNVSPFPSKTKTHKARRLFAERNQIR